MSATVSKVVDNVDKVKAAVTRLSKVQTLVGIPAEKGPRQDPKQPSNALLGYVHENGVPEHNLPARPFLKPGVTNAQRYTVNGLHNAAKLALEGKESAMMKQLNAVGMNAAQSVQRKLQDGPFAPLSPRTIAARMRKLKGTTQLTAADRALGSVDIRPLIDTQQLLRSVTWVVRERK